MVVIASSASRSAYAKQSQTCVAYCRWLIAIEQRKKAKAKVHLELGKLLLQYKTKKESNFDNNE